MAQSRAEAKEAEARRLGQFEGTVMTTLTAIQVAVEKSAQAFTNLDGRVRASENAIQRHEDMFKDSLDAHNDIYKKLETVATSVVGQGDYINKLKGFIIAAGLIGPIISAVIVTWILKALHL